MQPYRGIYCVKTYIALSSEMQQRESIRHLKDSLPSPEKTDLVIEGIDNFRKAVNHQKFLVMFM